MKKPTTSNSVFHLRPRPLNSPFSEEAMPFNYANEDGGGMNKSLFFQIMDEVFAGSMYKDIEDKYGSEIAKEYLKYGDDNGHFDFFKFGWVSK
jgi:hypothetical protein